MRLRLKDIRKEKGLTQARVAELAGMSQSYYTELENGKKPINSNRMDQLAAALGVTPSELIIDQSQTEHVELLSDFRALSGESQKMVYDLVKKLRRADAPDFDEAG